MFVRIFVELQSLFSKRQLRQGKARSGGAWPGPARFGKARQFWHGVARYGKARHGLARQGSYGVVWQGEVWHGAAS